MVQTVFVTAAQVMAAQMLVDRDRALGREPDPATQAIADARPARRAVSGGSSSPGPVRFWDALDRAERETLRTVASWKTFAPGEKLMAEGDKGDHVVVILGGRAKVSVDEDGRERVVAVRDLGQLVGERTALQVNESASLRSATVTALELVWGLVINSDDFGAFVRDHPRVHDIVQDQNYGRLTESPPASSAWSSENLAVQYSPHRPERLNGENYTVVLIDVLEANHARTESDRLLIREAVWRMTAAAVERIPGAQLSDPGSAVLVVAPSAIPIAEVMSPLLTELPGAIERHNDGHDASARFQLRLAINVGPAFGNMAEVTGEVVDVATVLLGALPFERAIVSSSASLGIIVSPFIYETFIKPGPDRKEEASYTPTTVEVQGSSTTAWVKLVP